MFRWGGIFGCKDVVPLARLITNNPAQEGKNCPARCAVLIGEGLHPARVKAHAQHGLCDERCPSSGQRLRRLLV